MRKFILHFSIALLPLSCFVNAQQGTVNVSQPDEIVKLMEYKKDIKTLKVYKIQVFQSVDPDLAKQEKINVLNNFAEWPVEIKWQTPNYKVWVGNFTTELEADRALVKIKKKYMNATVFQPRVEEK